MISLTRRDANIIFKAFIFVYKLKHNTEGFNMI